VACVHRSWVLPSLTEKYYQNHRIDGLAALRRYLHLIVGGKSLSAHITARYPPSPNRQASIKIWYPPHIDQFPPYEPTLYPSLYIYIFPHVHWISALLSKTGDHWQRTSLVWLFLSTVHTRAWRTSTSFARQIQTRRIYGFKMKANYFWGIGWEPKANALLILWLMALQIHESRYSSIRRIRPNVVIPTVRGGV